MGTTIVRGILVSLAILTLWVFAISLSQLLVTLLNLPQRLGFTIYGRLLGAFFVACGFLVFTWLARYRSPLDILNSTYVTFSKVVSGARLGESSGRTEPLVVRGPYRYVRHPLYSAVLLVAVGFWLISDYTFLLATTFLLFLWFRFVVGPFEERELRALFGEAYDEYARRVPRFIPLRIYGGRSKAD